MSLDEFDTDGISFSFRIRSIITPETERMAVHEWQPEIFKNPIQLVRPLTVDPTRVSRLRKVSRKERSNHFILCDR